MSDQPGSRTLSERESLLLSTLSADGHTLFTVEDARAVLEDGLGCVDAWVGGDGWERGAIGLLSFVA
jgi:hypothetical protein